MISWKIFLQLTMVILFGGAFTGCSQTAFFGEPEVPRGYSGTIPDIETNVYFYFNLSGSPEAARFISSSDLLATTVFPEIESLELSLASGADEFGIEMKLREVNNVDYAVHAINGYISGSPIQVEGSRHKINISGLSDWSQELRKAWKSDDRVPIQEHIQGADITLRLLPRVAPFEPVTLGFIRSPSDHIDTVMDWVDLNLPEFGNSIALMNIDTLVMAGYSDDEVVIIDRGAAQSPSIGPIAVIGVGRTSYPGVTLDVLLGRFADRIGLEPTIVGGEEVHYLRVKGGKHFFMKNYGSALFFCFAGSYDDALLLMESVIANQE